MRNLDRCCMLDRRNILFSYHANRILIFNKMLHNQILSSYSKLPSENNTRSLHWTFPKIFMIFAPSYCLCVALCGKNICVWKWIVDQLITTFCRERFKEHLIFVYGKLYSYDNLIYWNIFRTITSAKLFLLYQFSQYFNFQIHNYRNEIKFFS